MMNISNCKEGQVVEINIGGEILRTKVTPNVKSNIIHTEAYVRVMDQLSDYLKNNPGIQQLRIWLDKMKIKVVERITLFNLRCGLCLMLFHDQTYFL